MKDQLKEKFVKYFGEELCDEQDMLKEYQDIIDLVSKDYLGIEPIPVVFESLDEDISRYDFKLQAIILNRKYKNDHVELIDSCLHELEHHWQRIYIANNDTPKAKRWKNELQHYDKYNITQEIEIDACAFAQVIMRCELGIIHKHPDKYIQYLIDDYINTRKILNDD